MSFDKFSKKTKLYDELQDNYTENKHKRLLNDYNKIIQELKEEVERIEQQLQIYYENLEFDSGELVKNFIRVNKKIIKKLSR